jgi:hypothetical protein
MVYLAISPLPVDVPVEEAINFEVSQNMPNPAFGETRVTVITEKASAIKFTVSNLLGQVVYRVFDEGNSAGAHNFSVDVSSFESGIYFYTVDVGNKSVTKKMLVN